MITVTRLNGTRVTVNALFIETVEETPDTIITLTTGKKIVVTEKTAELVALTQEYLSRIGLVRPTAALQQTEES
ncbi:flagellar FlbD family protein [Paenibacillus sp.]|uniref:flagellar FlbD family protein n=1 Tax=Paenibacillus sp. TaxID=58172 RepID=UPI002D3F595A|nr:flagellar FlbD family protein [Paenibacillus sp.]HZG84393.1 flagellar FlbD family protein [Paenibacillus sp.]